MTLDIKVLALRLVIAIANVLLSKLTGTALTEAASRISKYGE